MPEAHHAVAQAHKCDIEGCKEEATRSVSRKKVDKAEMSVSGEVSGSVHLCKKHYKELKKKTKTDRTYERLGW